MKTKFVSILVSIILLNGCSKIEREKNDLKEMNLNGNIKSLREFSYEAIDKFGKISKGKRLREHIFDKDKYVLFNQAGNIVEQNNYVSNDSLDIKDIYKYDNSGNKVEHNSYNSDGNLNNRDTYKYDDRNNKIERDWYRFDGKLNVKWVFKYDKRGNSIEEKSYKSDGKLDFMNTYKYDNKGNQIEQSSYDSDGVLTSKCNYKYDDKGNLIENDTYLSDGFLVSKITYKYDDYNNAIECNWFNAYGHKDGRYEKRMNYLYEYDNKSNWLKKTVFVSKIVKYIIEREIKYYE